MRLLFYASVLFLSASLLTQCASLQGLVDNTKPRSTTSTGSNSSTSQVRKNVVDFAAEQKGTRYKYAGRSPRTGFDCSGFTHYVLNAFDVELTPVSRVQEDEGKRINLKDAQAGDLIFFRKSNNGSVFHVALVVSQSPGNLTVIHSTSSRGVIMENVYDSSYWRTKIMSARDVLSR
jgi:cell wall-associated NlpC family hydrolase